MLQTLKDADLSLDISGMALRTLIMEIERDRREEHKMALFKKMQKDEEIKEKDEEMKEKDEELMRSIGWCSVLEEEPRAKEVEHEVSKGVMAKNADLQTHVASLRVEIKQSKARAVNLRGELSTRVEELGRAEKTRMTAVIEEATLGGALRVCRSERAIEAETLELNEASFEERIRDLEAELSKLNEQVIALRVEKAQVQAQPSTSHTFAAPGVSRELYEMWVHVEAQLEIYKSLKIAGKIFEAEFEEIRVKARAAHDAYGYDPGTPGEDNDEDALDRVASNPW
ncbi:uncharacterized protein [Nicotiana sylvestris]|uniref:uncharacterized protein n=1 Tax=Nicotiana sylvestris TaxID=4096 RepID=UPI00388C4D40